MCIFSFHGCKNRTYSWHSNKRFFFKIYIWWSVMSTETLATTKVKIAKIYASVLRNVLHGKLNNIEFCYKFCCIWPLGRLVAIIKDILFLFCLLWHKAKQSTLLSSYTYPLPWQRQINILAKICNKNSPKIDRLPTDIITCREMTYY